MSKNVYANVRMKRILWGVPFRQHRCRIKDVVDAQMRSFLSSVTLHRSQNEKWLSNGAEGLTYDELLSQYQTLTNYEWDLFELFFDGKTVKRRYKRFVYTVLECFEQWKQAALPQDSVCLYVLVQKGRLHNIKVKFHLMRDEGGYLNQDLNGYKQPVLQVIYTH